jgi:hypothetical protein
MILKGVPMKNFLFKILSFATISSLTIYFADLHAQSVASDTLPKPENYFNAGVASEWTLTGYDWQTSVTQIANGTRDNRWNFFVEGAANNIAVPLLYSHNQGVHAFSLKPRFQVFKRLNSFISFGPGVGPVFNYFYSSHNIITNKVTTKIFELGAQVSAIIKFDVFRDFNIMVSPALIDVDFWRKRWISPAGGETYNFTQTDNSVGFLYSIAVSAGMNF